MGKNDERDGAGSGKERGVGSKERGGVGNMEEQRAGRSGERGGMQGADMSRERE